MRSDGDVLDNAFWHALNGPQARVAERVGQAARYLSSYTPFAALPDDQTAEAWDDLARLVGPGNIAVPFRRSIDLPSGWINHETMPTYQMIGDAVVTDGWADGVRLGVDDVAEMTALVERTTPGPFAADTVRLGTYLGVRGEDGALIAMAGERMRVDGYTEISAVCTDPAHRGKRLSTALMGQLIDEMRARDETPILHVLVANTPAIRVYEAMGFTVRAEVEAAILEAPG